MSYTNFTLDIDADGIALVTWDMPGRSMNVFTEEAMRELNAIVDKVAGDAAIKGAVITSGKDTFSGGADITLLQKMLTTFAAEKGKDAERATKALFDNAGMMTGLFRKLETCGKPWVSAINGTCMGGAFELSLACHGRVAADSDKVKMALPEVKIGIFPGAGGTQRVPRLTDQQQALQMLTSGQTLSPQKAKSMGLIHEIAEPARLVETAKAMIRNGLKPVAPWDEKGFKLPGGQIYSPAGFNLWPPAIAILRRETYGNYPAAAAILKCVYEGLLVPFDTGLRIEQRYFTEIMQTKEAAAMIRSLFVSLQELNKGARRPAGVPETKFKKVGILGAGFMGAGIAYVTAKAGIPVVLLDRDLESAAKGKAHSDSLISDQVKKGRAKPEDKDKLLSLITPTADYADLAGCDLVVEAVFEDSSVKKSATEQAEAVLKPSAIFASNTSTIPITGLAKNSARPKNFIGIHFFSPVDKMMLVEIILGKKTGDKALATAIDFVRAIKKTPIVVNDTRGFYVNRCVLRYMSEAYKMLIEGVPAPMIENAAKAAGMPVGPLALTDETAIDLAQKIMKQTIRDLGDKAVDPKQMALINAMVDDHGRFGRKNGKGFYDYPAKPAKKKLWPGLRELYPQLAPEKVDYEELQQRLLVTIALEAARVMEEGIVTDPREADVGSILAFGFAPYTGGALSYIDGIGAKAFVKIAKNLQKKYGAEFKAPKLLLDMAEKGETFYQRFDPYAKGDVKQAA
ncbi:MULTISPECIES: 3-hydroxyacyl-CoA dehydrogenase NAD-binding domain-containing protein [unclassified Mesorhizobium]|uniref:3-hydroxyacyl-CoA dehydrogenase NAD-binding domain-containing protein n=2 Tax=Mesorhizobium TaxID=68287 RepID=UPI000FCC427F|nr:MULTISPECIES: 3-hydroxyacyl-CoA dehydrogenase NAD-binding domain-containing protein [unclassified Mesorhizobium]RUU63129.1 3-hydroxyacyl-CoA dehydrogenase [Mesorhizobium sp. M7A.T.Ca.TU.009.01.1.1]RUU90894.1 3-hydroxyacyl-CoA dehydrogenase [Mesorhizobium sp. M7A.T.Ca.TU.009.01.1.2]RUT88832.1 3-hydroxyacyl-CoA dehydrogenase [Mesorhizobium sp. M7A.T.Ca.US.000.02.1.1]RUT94445.1 3-hydroxyacyl-CoA dehydrogenase [Mesorhizobium sp. M7A.T.Ca.US.000.02.2.1]RWN45859.1 MAG: 3-hydroxyacyl-CoA dehydroge